MTELLKLYHEFVKRTDPEFLPNAHVCLWRHLMSVGRDQELINHAELSHYMKDKYLFLIIFFEKYLED